jgi:hypothetical protein
MDPFNGRLIDKVNFFLFDETEESVWTNSDLSVILNEEPDEEQVANFYKINETP